MRAFMRAFLREVLPILGLAIFCLGAAFCSTVVPRFPDVARISAAGRLTESGMLQLLLIGVGAIFAVLGIITTAVGYAIFEKNEGGGEK